MFEWNQHYSVGIKSIDAQHQSLFAIASELYTAMSAGQGKAAVSRILDRLVKYTQMHFAHEERLMRQFAFPKVEEHVAEHAELTRKVLEFQEDFRSGRVNITVQLLTFLKNWLGEHIRGSDMLYAPYFKGQAVA